MIKINMIDGIIRGFILVLITDIIPSTSIKTIKGMIMVLILGIIFSCISMRWSYNLYQKNVMGNTLTNMLIGIISFFFFLYFNIGARIFTYVFDEANPITNLGIAFLVFFGYPLYLLVNFVWRIILVVHYERMDWKRIREENNNSHEL